MQANADETCSTQLHEARKRLPMEMFFADPQPWPEAGLVLWRCRYCSSHVCVPMVPAMDEAEFPTMIKEAM